MDWLRWHIGTTTDPKWRVAARRSGQPLCAVVALWAHMLEHASESAKRGTLAGWDDEVAAAALDLSREAVAAIRTAMEGLVSEGEALTGWAKRQPNREDPTVAERVRRHRARKQKEAAANPAPDADVTLRNEAKREVTTEEKRVEKKRTDTDSSVLKLHAGEAQDREGQMSEIIRAANRGMIDNPAIGSRATPIPTGHGSREDVREWLDLAPFDVVQRAVYERAKEYAPNGRHRQVHTMAYFTGAVQDAAERWKATQTKVSSDERDRPGRDGAPAQGGGREPDRATGTDGGGRRSGWIIE